MTARHNESEQALGGALGEATAVHFEGQCFTVRRGETVFEALLRGGADIRYSCKKGSCHTCLLQVTDGVVPTAGQTHLSPELVAAGAFLPCITRPTGGAIRVQRLDAREILTETLVASKDLLAPDVIALKLEPPNGYVWHAGQYLMLVSDTGQARPFSIVGSMSDYFIELHIRCMPGGSVSGWVKNGVEAGSGVKVQSPRGEVHYRSEFATEPLVLLGTGTGAGMLLGIATAALAAGHVRPIRLVLGARTEESFYLRARCEQLAREFSNFGFVAVVAGGEHQESRLMEEAFASRGETLGQLFLCGNPRVVASARVRALAVGYAPTAIHADPFTSHEHRVTPRDKEKLGATAPDPELWQALGEGRLLRQILVDFYQRVYADPRLAPFFHRVTMERAIDKQYEFLRDVFSGTKDYFGAKPFNAHHWMVISDELFDYREALFFECVARCSLEQRHIRAWRAVHELFRPELVKNEPRGLIVDGVEQIHEPFADECLSIAAVCDGCAEEIPSGAVSRTIRRTGQLFCASCARTVAG